MTVRCGNKVHDKTVSAVHHHETVAKVRLCFARTDEGGLWSIEEEDDDIARFARAAERHKHPAEND